MPKSIASLTLAVILFVCPQAHTLAAEDGAQTQPSDESVRVAVKTTLGDIVIELDQKRAPISCENFLRYTDQGYYNGTIFHRVISNFMIQGGGMTADMKRKPTAAPIKNEWKNGLKNTRGSIAMARLGYQADSATSQFFINVEDNPSLDRPNDGAGYAVFGRVVGGMDVVDRIRAAKTTTRAGQQDVPAQPIVIESMTRVSENDSAP